MKGGLTTLSLKTIRRLKGVLCCLDNKNIERQSQQRRNLAAVVHVIRVVRSFSVEAEACYRQTCRDAVCVEAVSGPSNQVNEYNDFSAVGPEHLWGITFKLAKSKRASIVYHS